MTQRGLSYLWPEVGGMPKILLASQSTLVSVSDQVMSPVVYPEFQIDVNEWSGTK